MHTILGKCLDKRFLTCNIHIEKLVNAEIHNRNPQQELCKDVDLNCGFPALIKGFGFLMHGALKYLFQR